MLLVLEMALALAAALPLLLAAPSAGAPALSLAPAAARPGDAVLVEVRGAPGTAAPQGTLAGRPLAFWRAGDRWRALGALPIEAAPGEVPAKVDAGGAALLAGLRVVEPGFAAHALSLPPAYVEPP